jgi:hypothetical protein
VIILMSTHMNTTIFFLFHFFGIYR